MPVLIAVVALVGALCTLNLVLTLGVVKRLREHTEMLGAVQGDPVRLEVGQEVGEFDTSTTLGEPLIRDLLSGPALFGFFSPTCEPCRDKLPRFVEYARQEPGGRSSVIATVVGNADAAAEFVTELTQVAHVVVEDSGGAMTTALGIRAFPSVLRAERETDGRLVVVDDDVALGRSTSLTA
ncbi:TlpA family protein disulfide reductase [Streptomyces sp. NPDC050121]|uniref:TlpA family protein disulfide reductase n=1 Tax=Streptomyces sp. NPDC050121 TaxID=3365601 RepID=UPI00379AAFAD